MSLDCLSSYFFGVRDINFYLKSPLFLLHAAEPNSWGDTKNI